jgi:peptidoglycan/xylan/chitin deacetylase (PgdA/CDA1 family)
MTESPLDRIHLNRRGFVAATLASGLSLIACDRVRTPTAMTTPASSGGSTGKYVALTFDDGPSPFTDRLLRVLADNDAKATFFLIGNKVALNPDGAKRIADAGMEIGNHTWEHPNMTTIAVEEIPRQLSAASAAIAAATGQSPRLYRPPGGLSNDAVRAEAARQGLAEILWDVVPFDWINDSNTAATEYMLKTQIKPGSLVDMHDTYSSTVDIVYQFLPVLKANGYQMVTVRDLLGPREPGSSYGRRVNGPPVNDIVDIPAADIPTLPATPSPKPAPNLPITDLPNQDPGGPPQ